MATFLLRKLEHNGKSRWSPMGRRVWELMVFFIPWRFKVNNSEWGTLFQIFIFSPKIQLWFPMKIVDFLGVKNSWKCCGFGLFSCWQLWFHEKNCQKNFGRKTRENVGVFLFLEFKLYWIPNAQKWQNLQDFQICIMISQNVQ